MAIAMSRIHKNNENPVSSLETGFFIAMPTIYPFFAHWQLPNREQCALGSRKTKPDAKHLKEDENCLFDSARAFRRRTGLFSAFPLADIDVLQLILLSFF
jgi:hypothetical protein